METGFKKIIETLRFEGISFQNSIEFLSSFLSNPFIEDEVKILIMSKISAKFSGADSGLTGELFYQWFFYKKMGDFDIEHEKDIKSNMFIIEHNYWPMLQSQTPRKKIYRMVNEVYSHIDQLRFFLMQVWRLDDTVIYKYHDFGGRLKRYPLGIDTCLTLCLKIINDIGLVNANSDLIETLKEKIDIPIKSKENEKLFFCHEFSWDEKEYRHLSVYKEEYKKIREKLK